MSRKGPPSTPAKGPIPTPKSQPAIPEKKAFYPEEYVTMTIPLE